MTAKLLSRTELIAELRRRIEKIVPAGGQPIPLLLPPLNALLPAGGILPGTLLEWVSEADAGVYRLALACLPFSLRQERTWAVVDAEGAFYPAGLHGLGVDFERIYRVHPRKRDFLWALEQTLRCEGVGVSLAELGPVSDRVLRRLRLAVEAGGGIGILFRPASVRHQPTWAQLRLWVEPRGIEAALLENSALPAGEADRSSCFRWRVEVLYCQGGISGTAMEVKIDDATGDVSVVSPLATASDARQAT